MGFYLVQIMEYQELRPIIHSIAQSLCSNPLNFLILLPCCKTTNSILVIIFIIFRIQLFSALGTNAVRKICFRALYKIMLNRMPILMFIADILTMGADRNNTPQSLQFHKIIGQTLVFIS